MNAREFASIGSYRPGATLPAFAGEALVELIRRIREPLHIVREAMEGGRVGVAVGRGIDDIDTSRGELSMLGMLPALYPEWLGDRAFCEAHAVRFPYVVGEMANGIATTDLVAAAAHAGVLGFFGAAGLGLDRVEAAIDTLERTLGERASWGVNLIHSPNEAALEDAVADLLVRRGVRRISASAFMALAPSVVRCAASGLQVDSAGRIVRRAHVFAKVSRPEVARHFLEPAPREMLRALVASGALTEREAALASQVPIASDLTVEADSGGHTDNQALTALFPSMLRLRDEIAARFPAARSVRIGAAGGLGTPAAVAAAFALGAAYVLTGSINQAAVESGLSDAGKRALAQADVADVTMAPAADMFELGVKVQVLKRGTMFGMRAASLYETYRAYPSLEAIPRDVRAKLEREVFRESFDRVWQETRAFWAERDPSEAARADEDDRRRMALVFRWYLGKSSRWAIEGEPSRALDYQIWCGPAMGAFNRWTAGSFLAEPRERTARQIALNLLEGAAVITRAHQTRTYGVALPPSAFDFAPRRLS